MRRILEKHVKRKELQARWQESGASGSCGSLPRAEREIIVEVTWCYLTIHSNELGKGLVFVMLEFYLPLLNRMEVSI